MTMRAGQHYDVRDFVVVADDIEVKMANSVQNLEERSTVMGVGVWRLSSWRAYCALVLLLLCSGSIQAQQMPELQVRARFEFIATTPSDVQVLLGAIDECSAASRPFSEIVQAIPAGHPLVTQVGDSLSILFAAPWVGDSFQPRFRLRPHDLYLFPTPSEVRRWAPDSSWAMTRCEALGHELSEAIFYRDAWAAQPPDFESPLARFNGEIRRAHEHALFVERQVALAQATRRTDSGAAYARSGECFTSGAAHVSFGRNTESINIRRSVIVSIAYNPNVNFCSWP